MPRSMSSSTGPSPALVSPSGLMLNRNHNNQSTKRFRVWGFSNITNIQITVITVAIVIILVIVIIAAVIIVVL